jgi:alginate O-acetyltransferase complex protein AlgI
MVFSSHLFLFYFLPAALVVYHLSPRPAKNLALTAVSYVFYGWTNPWFVLLIAWSTLVDYACGNLISGHWRLLPPALQRRVFVAASLVSNVGMLLFFKYAMFLQENLNRLRELFGEPAAPVMTVLLPAGISFYTFESISYNLDIYFGRARPAIAWMEELHPAPPGGRSLPGRLWLELRALVSFACYITQFPHLVAGPVIRYQDLERQIHLRSHTVALAGRGVFFFCLGFAKKILIANPCGEVADAAFAGAPLHTLDAWWGLWAYAFQIYFDFSGYSDMAVGLAAMTGFEFPRNFDRPYQSRSLTEFWRRWHVSLSTWLRDYLYIPLGGNRAGVVQTYVNLLVVMLIGGLWHGASWNFVLWGGVHGVWLCAERLAGKDGLYGRAPDAVRVGLTFLIVCVAWVFFRATDLPSAAAYLAALSGLQGDPPATAVLVRAVLYSWDHLLWMAVAAWVAFRCRDTWEFAADITPAKAAIALFLLVWSAVAMSTQTHNPFLYFQF